jgi:hypothetical protein
LVEEIEQLQRPVRDLGMLSEKEMESIARRAEYCECESLKFAISEIKGLKSDLSAMTKERDLARALTKAVKPSPDAAQCAKCGKQTDTPYRDDWGKEITERGLSTFTDYICPECRTEEMP